VFIKEISLEINADSYRLCSLQKISDPVKLNLSSNYIYQHQNSCQVIYVRNI